MRARVGWLHRLLRRSRRLPLGDRLQPRSDRPARPAVTSGGFETGARAPSSTTGTPGARRLPPPPAQPERGRRASVRHHDGTVGRPVRVRGGWLSRRRHRGRRDAPGPGARRAAADPRVRRGRDVVRRPGTAADAVAQPHPGRRVHLRRTRPPARADRARPAQRLARAGAVGGVVAGGARVVVGVAQLPPDGAERLPVDRRPARALRPLRGRADGHPDRDQPQRPPGAVRLAVPTRTSTAGPAPVDGWELTLPASLRLLADDRQIPVGEEDVTGTAYDFRAARPLHDTRPRPRVRRPGSRRRGSSPPSRCATRRPGGASRSGSTNVIRG